MRTYYDNQSKTQMYIMYVISQAQALVESIYQLICSLWRVVFIWYDDNLQSEICHCTSILICFTQKLCKLAITNIFYYAVAFSKD
jgi:hypothetical protein